MLDWNQGKKQKNIKIKLKLNTSNNMESSQFILIIRQTNINSLYYNNTISLEGSQITPYAFY